MFTGIIEGIGEVVGSMPSTSGLRIRIACRLDLSDMKVGDSIAVNGACLTAIAVEREVLSVDVSQETLNCTTGFGQGDQVNLEKALRASDRLDGHWVSGHVDGVGTVGRFEAIGEHALLQIAPPRDLAKYIARKGSIAVNGVSLTVNEVQPPAADAAFRVNLIPHTLRATNLGGLRQGGKVNLEIDMLARYAERLAQFGAAG